LNVFALVLLLMPIAGVAVSLLLHGRRALIIDALLAIVGVVMIPLVMLTLGHAVGRNASLASSVAPGMGMILITVMLLVVAVSSGIAALQARR